MLRRWVRWLVPSAVVWLLLLAIGALGIAASARSVDSSLPGDVVLAVQAEEPEPVPEAEVPDAPVTGSSGADVRALATPTVNGLFYRDGDYLLYGAFKAENPGQSALYWYKDGDTLYAALVLDQATNDNVFGDPKLTAINGGDLEYVVSAGWAGGGNKHNFGALYSSDHAVWSLFCGPNYWSWQQDLLWYPSGTPNPRQPAWRSDPYGPDGTTPPTAFITSASSIQWNMNYNTPLGANYWDVTLNGLRTDWAKTWKSPDYGTPNTVLDAQDNWWTVTALGNWEWVIVYECEIDLSICGPSPFTLWPVTGHNSPPKDGTSLNIWSYDFGDLPDTYQTLTVTNGPRHQLTTTLWMGDIVDPEGNGVPTVGADGDDLVPADASDDEDGVLLTDLVFWPGQSAQVHVTVTNQTGQLAYLYGFIDFDGSGAFDQPGEFATQTIGTGAVKTSVVLDFGTVMGIADVMYARFRLSTDTAAANPYGLAIYGEVEDYVAYPTWSSIESFDAYVAGGGVTVRWSTSAEIGTVGFRLLRLDAGGEYLAVHEGVLPALLTSPEGGTYRYLDAMASPGKSYTYQLVEVEANGAEIVHGPFTVKATAEGGKTVPGQRETAPAQAFQAQARAVSEDKQGRVEALGVERKKVTEELRVLSGERLKIAVRESGLYYLDAADIASWMGLSFSDVKKMIRDGGLALSNQGQSVAWLADDGNNGLLFYGQALDSLYTFDNVYWLSQGDGLVMGELGGKAPQPVAGDQTFLDVLHVEADQFPLLSLSSDPDADYWAWDRVVVGGGYPQPVKSFAFEVGSPASIGQAQLKVSLYGGTSAGADPDHHVSVYLNGHLLGEGSFDGIAAYELMLPAFQASWLVAGENTVEVHGGLPAGVTFGVVWVESLDLTYPRLYQAVEDRLWLRGDGNAEVTVSGLGSADVLVLDVTSAAAPKLVTAARVNGTAPNHTVTFAPSAAATEYLVVSEAAWSMPQAVWADQASDLYGSEGADYVIVAPSELASAAQAWADYRQAQGHTTLVATLEDVYDEFNHGIASPYAIQAFLSHAYHNWSLAPEYVVLAGEGTYDYKDLRGFHDSVLPVMMVNTPDGLFAADNRFADVDQDGVPEMAIGRLPVLTASELQALLAKVQAYEAGEAGDWAARVLMVADNPDLGGQFHQDSKDLAKLLPSGFDALPIYLQGPADLAARRQQLLAEINQGAVLLNYLGHASITYLGGGPSEQLLRVADVSGLQNGTKLPVFTAMTCVAGQFSAAGFDSLSEVLLLKQGGGVVAAWSPTGLSYNFLAKMLDEEFFGAAFQDGVKTLGDAVLAALTGYDARGGAPYLIDIYNLLGDPALQMK